jgi:DNA-binding winged helix-turn-helix (wHTH) protein
MSRTVDMHIMELRRKLEADPANPRHFCTVRKTGIASRGVVAKWLHGQIGLDAPAGS